METQLFLEIDSESDEDHNDDARTVQGYLRICNATTTFLLYEGDNLVGRQGKKRDILVVGNLTRFFCLFLFS
jgi:hypothetical protein